ncbi:phosphoadenosine phosphosulfate reductase [Massilia violaceinigra]|uniref:Phosphoadenosine phosphosulfate reductase n=1 Tax=Massilia violaceinigra TaxID=2045208 RepID=A0A2D2DSC5_9BURK|nr:phosphoadenosine phosphosulfate reductase family protein [Massilia violaceinigra]ATQ77882.1 phosphoadenosine phosphosulfate reductase [Massilia violaceinigra]
MSIIHVVSCSTGKDSVATLLLAAGRFGTERVRGILCDTGNEHEYVFEHRLYLERATGVRIDILTANFDEEIAGKRRYIARDVRTRREYATEPVFDAAGEPVLKRDGRGNIVLNKKGTPVQKTIKVGGGKRVRWTNKAKRRALAVLQPSGNPFLDLCMWKGRFPSRKAQFCTEHLKRNMAVEYQLALIEQGHTVVSWQGVRRDESLNRRDAKQFERVDRNFFIYRPLVEWNVARVFKIAEDKNIEPNPLYKCGMGRVGCMPCINASKDEIHQIGIRFPEHIAKVAEWERLVGLASKRNAATFMHKSSGKGLNNQQIVAASNIHAVVEWAKTTRGGKQFSLLTALEEPTSCASSYGLCE